MQAPTSRGSRAGKFRRLIAVGFLTMMAVSLGCREDARSPTEPVSAAPANTPESAVTSNTWVARAALPNIERWGLATAVVRNAGGPSILYAIGGKTAPGATSGSLSKVQAYNVATNTWTNKASLPVPLFWTNGAGVIDGKIYISGGLAAQDAFQEGLFVYDPAANTWTAKRNMPSTGYHGVTGVINGKLYVLTGCDQENCNLPQLPMAFYRYNPVTDQWATLPIPSQPTPSSSHKGGVAGVIGGKLYVAGGQGNTRLDVYDPVTNQWTVKASMPRVCGFAAGTALAGKLYVVGGNQLNPDGSVTSCKTSVYDPATNAWTTKAAAPTVRAEAGASRVVVNGEPRIELVGGSRPGNNLQYVP
jgi:N-acetylneuraminic acid mutarotase